MIGPIGRDAEQRASPLPRRRPRRAAGATGRLRTMEVSGSRTCAPTRPIASLGTRRRAQQRDLLLRHVERVETEIETLRVHLDHLQARAAALWDAHGHCGYWCGSRGEFAGREEVLPRLQEVVLR